MSVIDKWFPKRITDGMALSSWERQDDILTKLTMEDLYGIDVDGIADVSRSEAMKISAVLKIRNRICAKIAGMPFAAMKGQRKYEYAPKWISNMEPGRANFVTVSWLVDSLIFYGRAWLIVTGRTANGVPQSFQFVPMWQAQEQGNRLVKAWGQDVAPNSAVLIEAHHAGLLTDGQDVLKRAALIERAAQRAADNPVPSIELHQKGGPPMNDDEITKMLSWWSEKRKGKNGGVAYTNEQLETKTHGQAAEQLLIAGRNLAAIDVARAMGAPAWSIDATTNGSSITYGNVESRSRELIEDTLEPYMNAICGRLSLDDILPAGVWVRLDSSQLTRENFRNRMSGYKSAIDGKIYTAEEVRLMEDGIPLEESGKNE